MGRFVVRRLGQGAATLLLASLVFHASVTLLPGDPIRAIWGPSTPPPDVLAAIRADFRLDDPYPVQYASWLGDLARGDLGTSYPREARGSSVARQGAPVADLLGAAVPVSIRLLLAALLAHLAIGVAAGVGAVLARRRSRSRRASRRSARGPSVGDVLDQGAYATAIVAVSAPAIVLAYAGQVAFGFELGWLPVRGVSQGWVSYLLPAAAMATTATGYIALLSRRELTQTMRERFIAAALAHGLPERRVIAVHALRASLLPILTLAAANLGLLVAAQIIVEGVFDLPGLGGLVFDAIQRQDRALLVPAVTLITAAVILANLLADLLAAIVDPRLPARHER
ncbi:MAG: ABC transporter permease [Egibacteraceae bacterium]